jgi:hypothetical protein
LRDAAEAKKTLSCLCSEKENLVAGIGFYIEKKNCFKFINKPLSKNQAFVYGIGSNDMSN